MIDEHGGIRTPDPQNRNLMLYPTELHALVSLNTNLKTSTPQPLGESLSRLD